MRATTREPLHVRIRSSLYVAVMLATLVAGSFARAQQAGPPLRYPPDRPIDVERLRLDLDVDLDARNITGEAVLAGTAIVAKVAEIELDAVDLDIREVVDRR